MEQLPKQPQLAKQLKEAIGDTPRHVIAAEYGISPASLVLYIANSKKPKHERTIKALINILARAS